jgi:flagellar motor protein MotB
VKSIHGRSDAQGMMNPADDRPFDSPFDQVAIRLKTQFGDVLDLDKLHRGYRIRLDADWLFEPGSARLTAACRAALDPIARILASLYNPLRVDGHTDDRAPASGLYPTAWHLSVARAAAAARYLVEAGPLAPERVSVAGYAGHRPLHPNRSAALRARNRRIEIILLPCPPKRG